jgi:predicted negative regulator of RcsB-dependent stress response
MTMFHLHTGEFRTALHYARRFSAVAATTQDLAVVTSARSMLGDALYFCGELGSARVELESAVASGRRHERTMESYLGVDGKDLAGGMLAMNLWLLGHPAQAAERARQAIAEAAEMDHSLTLCIALFCGVVVFMWSGDLPRAEEHIERLISHAESHALTPYAVVGRGLAGEVAIRQGEAEAGVETLRQCREKLYQARHEVFTTTLDLSLVTGLAAVGRFDEGIAWIDRTIERVEANGGLCWMPELLRMRGGIQEKMGEERGAEEAYCRAIEIADHQSALSWRLRASINLARLYLRTDRRAEARERLAETYARFSEGFATADLKAAERLLATLS